MVGGGGCSVWGQKSLEQLLFLQIALPEAPASGHTFVGMLLKIK